MLEIYRCDNGTCFGQIVAVLFHLTDVSVKQSLYIFLTDIGGNDAFPHCYFIILVIQLAEA